MRRGREEGVYIPSTNCGRAGSNRAEAMVGVVSLVAYVMLARV